MTFDCLIMIIELGLELQRMWSVLQVELHNYFTQELQKELPVEVRFYNKKNLMRIILVEMEILVELSGETMPVFDHHSPNPTSWNLYRSMWYAKF